MSSSKAASVSEEEIARFSAQADQWWNPHGSFRSLHELGPVRVAHICEQTSLHLPRKTIKSGLPLKGLRVLDVGCGGGLLSEAMAERGADVVGLDASVEAIAVARAHAAQSSLTIDYREGSAESLAKADEQFDVITAFEIVEHVANLKSFIVALSQLLKPGGLLLIATVNRTKRSYLLGIVMAEYVLGWVPAGTHDWDKFVCPSEMVNLWGGVGIEALDITGLVYRPLSRSFHICKGNASVNYFMTGKKSKSAF
ncbi:MAG: bifunctional 2-polyprenyl-6-hydroxyphenol methylase/3-demethylubiquinol 3-O-methyltransferase UbiG [Alphaproteobacteria bacterium]|nr:bifunctional 2-polyprenyl-6-hydroxyphenol methylase/3-demethylubiquinol 3-O-methyltransferase UbiG [Alphaproteobacteria bacterium]